MKKFGSLKDKMLKKITESFTSENKNEIKDILKTIKENKELKEMYLFYEDFEKIDLGTKDRAELYLEIVEPLLIEKTISLNETYNDLFKKLKDIECETNKIYESLDVISEKNTLMNIDKKISARKTLIEHLTTIKQISENEDISCTKNENLLNAVLVNNFNTRFNDSLDESEKNELKNILSINEGEIKNKISELKETVLSNVEKLLTESKVDNELVAKLNDVKNEIGEMTNTKYNYYRLTQLKNGLN